LSLNDELVPQGSGRNPMLAARFVGSARAFRPRSSTGRAPG
jgi:hypothetical protein